MDPELMRQTLQWHQQDLASEAAHDRLAAQVHGEQPTLMDRMLLGAGDALVGSGLRLQAWYHIRRVQREWLRQHGALS